MADSVKFTYDTSLDLNKEQDVEAIAEVCDALSSPTRLRILTYLQHNHLQEIPKISADLGIPITTLMHHLYKLEKAEVIEIYYKNSKHSSVRTAVRKMKSVYINLHNTLPYRQEENTSYTQSVGVGCYTDFTGSKISLLTEDGIMKIEEGNFFPENRYNAQMIYTMFGRITYFFSNFAALTDPVKKIEFTLEICSEAPYYDNNYLSDITFWINGIEITTYTLDGDYGDRRGKLNPDWWPSVNTQYGKLLNLSVSKTGVEINGSNVNRRITINDLRINKENKIVLTFGNKDTAEHRGGFNLFGKGFGDHAQDICMSLYQ